MSSIRIGISRPKGFVGLFKPKSYYIVVPVDRRICVSYYLIHFSKDSVDFRRNDKFFEENISTFCLEFQVSEKKEKDLICWAKGYKEENLGLQTLGDIVFKEIFEIPPSQENLKLDTRTPSNLKYVMNYLKKITEEE